MVPDEYILDFLQHRHQLGEEYLGLQQYLQQSLILLIDGSLYFAGELELLQECDLCHFLLRNHQLLLNQRVLAEQVLVQVPLLGANLEKLHDVPDVDGVHGAVVDQGQ